MCYQQPSPFHHHHPNQYKRDRARYNSWEKQKMWLLCNYLFPNGPIGSCQLWPYNRELRQLIKEKVSNWVKGRLHHKEGKHKCLWANDFTWFLPLFNEGVMFISDRTERVRQWQSSQYPKYSSLFRPSFE